MAARTFSVANVLAATLVTVTTILFGALGVVSYINERDDARERLRHGVDAQASELAAALALPVWNIDRAQIDKILDSQEQTPQVQAVIVEAAKQVQGRARDREGRFVRSDGRVSPAGFVIAIRPISFSGERIGTVRLYATQRYIHEQLRDSLISMGLTALAIDFLLILSVYLVLWRTVVRPLTDIEKYAVAVSTAFPGQSPSPPALGFTRELESLRSCIETMVRQLDHRYADLKEHEELTETAVNAMTGVFFVQDRQGNFFRWNEAMQRLAEAEIPMDLRPGRTMVHPDDRDIVERAVERVFAIGHAEVEARIKVGLEFKSYVFSARRMDVRGQQFLVSTGVDITERREAEAEQRRLQEEIARSADEWKATFDTVSTPILITERDGAVIRGNRAALELSSLTEERIRGTRVDQINDQEPWQTAAQLVSYLADEVHGTSAETRDEGGRTWDITIARLSTPSETSERCILVFWEITGIVELQESLRHSETMSAMGTLVAGVAHEVRNPLFGISATLDAYDEEMSRPGYAECGATLRQEVNRLIHLMQELLEYGKPGALSIERGSIAAVVDRAVESRRQTAREAGVALVNTVASGTPPLLMDASRLRQVFENLIDNAVQHSERGGNVTIAGSVTEHAGRHWLECRVEDDGPGFSAETLDRVFEPFFTQREGGTGLGLSIVQRIVEEHSGKVFAANRPEGGGSIRVIFPLPENEMTMRSAS